MANKPSRRKVSQKAVESGPAMHLLAFDSDDLAIISAHLQDAITRVADIAYVPRDRRFALVTSRFDWTAAEGGALQRRLSGLHFDHVLSVQRSGFGQDKPDVVLNLLSIMFEAAEAPAGRITLLFSAGAAIRLDVECIDAQLNDMTSSWRARGRPDHRLQQDENLPDDGIESK